MAGPRFVDWSHIRVLGDRDAAAPYVGEARKLMGYVQEDAARVGLGVHSMRRELEDGTVIVAEKHGDIPRMTIIPAPQPGAEPPKRLAGDFVVWARDEDLPDGIHEDYPQQILQLKDGAWKTFFYSGAAEGYDDFDGAKGTYLDMFPTGVRHAGNIDWRSNDGLRVSWYGPSSRYFISAYVQPRAQYGEKVFMLGQELFDSTAYMEASETSFPERWVVGAAVSPDLKTLYVVHADLPQGSTLTGPSDPNEAEFSNPLPPGTLGSASPVPIAVCRYSLTRDPMMTEVMNFSVVPESREIIDQQTLTGAYNPWFFNGSASHAVSVGIPPLISAVYMGGGLRSLPSASGPLYEFNGAIVERAVSAPPGGSGVMAADFGEDGLRELVLHRRALGGSQDAWVFGLGSTEWVGRSFGYAGGWRVATFEWRKLLWCDLRSGSFAFYHAHGEHRHPTAGGGDGTRTDEVELWSGPVLLGTEAVVPNADPNEHATLPWTLASAFTSEPDPLYQEPALDAPYAPIFAIYALCASVTVQGIVTSRRTSYDGLHGAYLSICHDPAAVFGHFSTFGMTERLAISSRARPGSATNLPDTDGHEWVLGAAGYDGVAMYSGYDIFGAHNHDAIHLAGAVWGDTDLPELTGVDGPKARYHPIWLLGTPPSREAA